MTLVEVFLIALGLSMDAFAVSMTNGMCRKNVKLGWTIGIGACFGLFQGLMPAAGFVLGSTFAKYVQSFDHVIALVLLGFIGGKMLIDGVEKKDEDDSCVCVLTLGALLLQGVATSIDALAVGVSFAAVMDGYATMLMSVSVIALTTFVLSVIGVAVGKKFGDFLNNKAQIVGGLILIGIGVKIFVEHVFF